jgi:hypothetical protein
MRSSPIKTVRCEIKPRRVLTQNPQGRAPGLRSKRLGTRAKPKAALVAKLRLEIRGNIKLAANVSLERQALWQRSVRLEVLPGSRTEALGPYFFAPDLINASSIRVEIPGKLLIP